MTTRTSRWLQALAVYRDRRVLSVFFFGFAGGLPLLLVYGTLSAWLEEAGVTKTTIGFLSLVGTAYSLKVLWSPVVDRVRLPLLSSWLGRRRSWMLLAQLVLIAGLVGMARTDPSTTAGLQQTILWAVVVAFASATQDIVIDAYRIEIVEEAQLGAGAAMYVSGYRTGMLVAGAGALLLADLRDWSFAYRAMAVAMGIGVAAVLVNPEPGAAVAAEARGRERRAADYLDRTTLPGWLAKTAAWLHAAVIGPFAEFLTRRGWLAILLFVALYKYGDALIAVMANPFYLELGFTKTQIAAVSKAYGLAMTLGGTALGGLAAARLGILRALLVGGVLQAASNLVFAWQAYVGPSVPALMVTISVENLTGGIATAAFVAYLSSLCNVAYTATQYALLSSLMSAARGLLASGAGWLADQVDWVSFFVLTTAAALPGMALLLWLLKLEPPRRAPVPP